ncbi:MAG: hypothetical protein ACJ8GN_27375 [Longimicrobiaceae bacterium]
MATHPQTAGTRRAAPRDPRPHVPVTRAAWIALKLVGMVIVVLFCMAFIQRMAMVATMTGQWLYPVGMVLISITLVYWAYRVIWRPIRPGARV